MKKKVEIELDIPEGYEATGEFRKPEKGEAFLGGRGTLLVSNSCYLDRYVILRKTFEWPSCLKGWGIARDANGYAYWFATEPVRRAFTWERGSGSCRWRIQVRAIEAALGITFPKLTDWKTPLLNPNYEAMDDE